MHMFPIILCIGSIICATANRPPYIRISDDLDDSRGYCIDVCMTGCSIQAHNCKEGRNLNDQSFVYNDAQNIIHGVNDESLEQAGKCLKAACDENACAFELESNSTQCSIIKHTTEGLLIYFPSGDINDDENAKCIRVAEESQDAGRDLTDNRRDLYLEECDSISDTDEKYAIWDVITYGM
eukprot:894794_1